MPNESTNRLSQEDQYLNSKLRLSMETGVLKLLGADGKEISRTPGEPGGKVVDYTPTTYPIGQRLEVIGNLELDAVPHAIAVPVDSDLDLLSTHPVGNDVLTREINATNSAVNALDVRVTTAEDDIDLLEADVQTLDNLKYAKSGGEISGDVTLKSNTPVLSVIAGAGNYAKIKLGNASGSDIKDSGYFMSNGAATGTKIGHQCSRANFEGMGPGIIMLDDGSFHMTATTEEGVPSTKILSLKHDSLQYDNSDVITADSLQAFFNRIYPVGITYVQYTDTDNPNTLFPGTTWDDITNTIVSSGCRYPAFSPLNVGTKLDQELPNIRGEMNATPCAAAGWIGNGAFGESGKWGDYGCGYGNNYANGHYIFNANQSNGIYKDGANVQPYTYTVKLWKRTA